MPRTRCDDRSRNCWRHRKIAMKSEPLAIADIVRIVPKRLADSRGYFSEVYRERWFRDTVADCGFVQENQSLSSAVGTVRGLHFQAAPFDQGKLVRCLVGAIYDVAVDLRVGSPSYGKWVAAELSADNGEQLWIPAGFAHGFATRSPDTVIHYKVTAPYSAEHDRGLRWNDASLGVDWPVGDDEAILSDKDRAQPVLASLPAYFSYSRC